LPVGPAKVSTRFILLLTATLRPPPGVSARADPAVRLEDYRIALRFYLAMLGRGELARLVFVDNSDSDLGTLQAEAEAVGLAACCEFISFSGLDYPTEYGYGYGEFRLLDHAMTHSRLIRALPDAVVVKVTGRYVVRNLAALLRRLPPRFDVACDVRNRRKPWADTRVMAWTAGGYERVLRGVCAHLRRDLTRLPPEMRMAQHLHDSGGSFSIVQRLAPCVVGHPDDSPWLHISDARCVMRRIEQAGEHVRVDRLAHEMTHVPPFMDGAIYGRALPVVELHCHRNIGL